MVSAILQARVWKWYSFNVEFKSPFCASHITFKTLFFFTSRLNYQADSEIREGENNTSSWSRLRRIPPQTAQNNLLKSCNIYLRNTEWAPEDQHYQAVTDSWPIKTQRYVKTKCVCPRVFIIFLLQAPQPSGKVANESVNANKHRNNTGLGKTLNMHRVVIYDLITNTRT